VPPPPPAPGVIDPAGKGMEVVMRTGEDAGGGIVILWDKGIFGRGEAKNAAGGDSEPKGEGEDLLCR